jgi:hypothetical protein
MKKLNLWKRTLAGLLSLLVVSGYAVPAAYSGGLFARTAIVAEADDVISIKMEGSTLNWRKCMDAFLRFSRCRLVLFKFGNLSS